MARPIGSKNKVSLNLTQLWKDLHTKEDIEKAHQRVREALYSDDVKRQEWAVEFIAKRFTVSADKLVEAVTEREHIENRKEFEELLKGLIDEHKATVAVNPVEEV